MTLTRLTLALLLAVTAYAQSPSFEVVSVKPNISGSGRSTESTNPGSLRAENINAGSLIQQAFGVRAFQISGGPGWLTSDNYDVNAKTGTSKDLNDKELQPYLQALLADRFGFRYHRETKELPVYSLVVLRSGTKLTAHTGGGDNSTNISNNAGRSSIRSVNASMANLANLLGGRLDRLVIDNTRLTGDYDLELEWAPNPTAESTEPSLFTALQEQLGLKLESTKGPVEIIVIDNLDKPTEN